MTRIDLTNTITLETHPDSKDVEYIIKHLREIDRKEFAAVGVDPGDPAVRQIGTSQGAMMLRYKDEPVFVWGVMEAVSRNGVLWGFGTERTFRIVPALTRWVREVFLPNAFIGGLLKRIEVRVPISSQHSIGWLHRFGMRAECWTVLDHGVNGEPHVQLAYTTKDYCKHVHVQEQIGASASSECRPH